MSNFVTLPGNPGYCELTYSELKKLRDDAQLVPGLQYRITDYECTTTAQNSSSAGHAFDIIVTADSSDTLNENCRATQHADDAYFANNNLEAWELKYSFDGDCTKFAWGPNSVRSFTFLYSEDTPTAVRYPEEDIQNKYAWNIEGYDISGIYYTSTTDIKPGDYISFEVYNESTSSFSAYGTGLVEEITGYLLPSEYRGIIFYMKDEYGNECGYDFKNIKFSFTDSSSALIDSSTTFYYTFTDASTGDDLSMKKDASTICEKNYIGAINDSSTFDLPYTVFIASNSVFNNTIKHASNNVFGVAHDNDMRMVNDCVFDDAFDLNTVDTALNTWFKGTAEVNHIKYISNSEFGNNFAFNTIRYMSTTKAGDNFMLNDVGDYFINSSFGNNCYSNFFGPYSGTITTGNDFMQNTMQNQCHHLTFGNGCKFNNLGSVGYIRMGNNCTDNFIGNGKYVYFGNSSNQGADWICGNKFEGITQYVYFYNTSSASSSNMLRKYHMYNICGTSDTWKSISETTRNNSKETFVLTRPGYTTPAANSLIYVDPAMLPERTKGGTAGQILVKVSGTDYDMGWQTVNIGSQIVYDSSNKVISLKDASGNVLGTPVDVTDFIKDGLASSVTYSELKALRDSSSLVPGMQYRITDYHTRVSKTGMGSADHRFDVIVVADTSASLNENARVCHSAGDTANYYGGSELEAYEIRYCLDNDLSKFGWADSTTGTGVIWYMKDEYRNEAFYDFTNITFSSKYTFNNSGSDARLASGALIHDNVIKHHYDGYMNSQISDASFYTLTPNNIVFNGTFVYNNTFGPDCYDLKFGNQTVGNSFEGAVWDCSFGNTTTYNRFGTYITSCNFPAKLATSEIGSNCWYLNVTSSLTTVRCNILGSVKGTSASSKLAVAITEANQFIGLNSSGVLKKWIPADLIN